MSLGLALRKQFHLLFQFLFCLFCFSSLCFQLQMPLSFLLRLHATIPPQGTMMDSLSGNISQNKPHPVNCIW